MRRKNKRDSFLKLAYSRKHITGERKVNKREPTKNKELDIPLGCKGI